MGTYGGTMDGKSPPRQVANSRLEEELHCNMEFRFAANGMLTAELRKYEYTSTELKRSPAGDFLTVTRITGQPSTVTPQSTLSVWVTPSGRVQNIQWTGEPGPEFPGEVQTEMFKAVGPNQWQKVSQSSRRHTVYCYPQVLWLGKDRKGYGLPLRGSYEGLDVFGRREWVKVKAHWVLTPLGAR